MVVGVLVVAVGVGTGLGLGAPVLAGYLTGPGPAAAIRPPPEPVIPHPALRPATVDGPVPTSAGVSAALDPLVAAGELGALSGQVVDPATGTVLWQREPEVPRVPGSTVKLLTSAAALLALDHQARWHTTVLAGAEPGTVVLLGGGDPTLSAAGAGAVTGYPGAARLDDLVAAVRAAVPGPVRRVLVDTGRYTGDTLAPGWPPADVAGGYIAPIESVMLDGGRADPTEDTSPRSATPAIAAAAELARRLGADPATPGAVAVGSAPPGAAVLGVVPSAPVQDLVTALLTRSDNVLAEALAREVARATGAPASFAGATQAVLAVLRGHGFDVSRVSLVDGSGLSPQDVVPARLLTGLLSAAAAPDESQWLTATLRPLLVGLPVAGSSGTLARRYDGPAAGGRGWVRAKTGTLTGVNSLAGTVLDADGRVLVFALLSNGPNPSVTRPRLDALATQLRACGCH